MDGFARKVDGRCRVMYNVDRRILVEVGRVPLDGSRVGDIGFAQLCTYGSGQLFASERVSSIEPHGRIAHCSLHSAQ